MQWMIDGANGEHYRRTMGYPLLKPHNEHEPARKVRAGRILGRTVAKVGSAFLAIAAYPVLVAIVGYAWFGNQAFGAMFMPSSSASRRKEALTSFPFLDLMK